VHVDVLVLVLVHDLVVVSGRARDPPHRLADRGLRIGGGVDGEVWSGVAFSDRFVLAQEGVEGFVAGVGD
jgi:hypothetical protein